MSSSKIGLVLGCGASRGWAHIGVIEALREAGIPLNCVAGCSVGAFVGAIFASGGLERLKQYVIDMDGERMFSFADLSLIRSGLLDGDRKLKELFCTHSDRKRFEELDIPLSVVATDLSTGSPIILNSGDLLTALRASLSYPGLFAPVFLKGRWLVDGGLVDPIPVGVARSMGADIVIAVDLTSELAAPRRILNTQSGKEKKEGRIRNEFLRSLAKRYETAEKMILNRFDSWKNDTPDPPSTRQVVNASIEIMQERITRVNFAVSPPDIHIIPRLGDLRLFDYDQVEHAIEEGYLAARNRIEDILTLMETRSVPDSRKGSEQL